MSDRMAAEIWIGGKLRRSLVDEFPVDGLRVGWDGPALEPVNEQNVLEALDEDSLLHFADCEIAWGEFTELEGWLREHGVPFIRCNEAKYDTEAQRIEYRPDLPGKPDRETLIRPSGAMLVECEPIEKILRSMAKLVGGRKRSATKRIPAWEGLYRKLRRAVPAPLPDLPPLEIVDGPPRRRKR